jgi:hypothetical protein
MRFEERDEDQPEQRHSDDRGAKVAPCAGPGDAPGAEHRPHREKTGGVIAIGKRSKAGPPLGDTQPINCMWIHAARGEGDHREQCRRDEERPGEDGPVVPFRGEGSDPEKKYSRNRAGKPDIERPAGFGMMSPREADVVIAGESVAPIDRAKPGGGRKFLDDQNEDPGEHEAIRPNAQASNLRRAREQADREDSGENDLDEPIDRSESQRTCDDQYGEDDQRDGSPEWTPLRGARRVAFSA